MYLEATAPAIQVRVSHLLLSVLVGYTTDREFTYTALVQMSPCPEG